MSQSEIFNLAKVFITYYFKIGQLIKIIVRSSQGMYLETDYGFIKYISFNKIIFTYIEISGELKEKTITPTDLCQNELEINIEIVADKAKTMGG